MKTIVIVSDTHGNKKVTEELATVLSECDIILHLGDTSEDGSKILAAYPEKTHLFNGNCDGVKLGLDEEVLEVENVRIFATHGHLYSARYTLEKMAARAKELQCSVCLYGHTHKADERVVDGVAMCNPGTMQRRAVERSYGYMVVTGDKAVFKPVFI